jgi:hypothetical protein
MAIVLVLTTGKIGSCVCGHSLDDHRISSTRMASPANAMYPCSLCGCTDADYNTAIASEPNGTVMVPPGLSFYYGD